MEVYELSKYKTVGVIREDTKTFIEFKHVETLASFRINPVQFNTILFYTPEISNALKSFNEETFDYRYLSDGIWVKVQYPYKMVDIREWVIVDGFRKPTKSGFTLNTAEFQEFLTVANRIHFSSDHIKDAQPFEFCQTGHLSQLSEIHCKARHNDLKP